MNSLVLRSGGCLQVGKCGPKPKQAFCEEGSVNSKYLSWRKPFKLQTPYTVAQISGTILMKRCSLPDNRTSELQFIRCPPGHAQYRFRLFRVEYLLFRLRMAESAHFL